MILSPTSCIDVGTSDDLKERRAKECGNVSLSLTDNDRLTWSRQE
jgi:hypothetical protein